ncbi:hypothetical protein RQP46_003800 [Phenoliferia psychrophenolica]
MSTWPPTLTPDNSAALLSLAADYALSHGLVLRPTSLSSTSSIHAPYALFPSPFPRHLFDQAIQLQPLYNALYSHVALDNQFLKDVVGGAVAKVDEFQGKLYEMWEQVEKEGVKQPLHLGLFRSDYLLHSPPGISPDQVSIKQVEFNTISSSFGPLASKVGDLHRYLQKSGAYPVANGLELDNLPINKALVGLAAGLAAGHKAYASPNAKILMVVQDAERNAFDQRALDWELQETHNIGVLRIPFSTLHLHASLSPTTSALLISSHPSLPSSFTTPIEISVVYYRAGYTPTDYPSSTSWATRLLLERSLAIKCPTLALQLAGAKKVQQVLSSPTTLDSFLSIGSTQSTLSPPPIAALTPTDASLLLSSFTSLYPLDSTPAGQSALALAVSEPERFVLKPQREGGGNNVYRHDIPPYLASLASSDLSKDPSEPKAHEGYILMDLIEPPKGVESVMVRAGEEVGVRAEVVSELGVYGVALFRRSEEGGKGAEMLVNETVGHLLRTKGIDSDEGGVAVGFSVVDSPLLV